jgi:hypothetical protein
MGSERNLMRSRTQVLLVVLFICVTGFAGAVLVFTKIGPRRQDVDRLPYAPGYSPAKPPLLLQPGAMWIYAPPDFAERAKDPRTYSRSNRPMHVIYVIAVGEEDLVPCLLELIPRGQHGQGERSEEQTPLIDILESLRKETSKKECYFLQCTVRYSPKASVNEAIRYNVWGISRVTKTRASAESPYKGFRLKDSREKQILTTLKNAGADRASLSGWHTLGMILPMDRCENARIPEVAIAGKRFPLAWQVRNHAFTLRYASGIGLVQVFLKDAYPERLFWKEIDGHDLNRQLIGYRFYEKPDDDKPVIFTALPGLPFFAPLYRQKSGDSEQLFNGDAPENPKAQADEPEADDESE